MPTPTATIYLPYSALDDVLLRGTRAAQPAASAVTLGTLYAVTDEGKVEQSTGSAWVVYGGAGSGALTPHHATHEPGGTDAIAALDAGVLTTGTLPNARLAPTTQITSATTARLALTDLSQPANARSAAVTVASQTLALGFLDDALATPVTPIPLVLDRVGGSAHIGGDITEKGRTTPLGHWTAVPYSPGIYSAYPAGAWAVDAGDQATLSYMLIGKTMWLTFLWVSMSVSGSPTELRLTIPAGCAGGVTSVTQMVYNEGAGWQTGYCSTAGAAPYVRFQKDPGSLTTWGTTTNGTAIYGTVPLPIA